MITLLIIGGLFCAAVFFLPTIVAVCRGTAGWFWVFVINLVGGWTLIGWIVAYVYACGPTKKQLRWQAAREQLAIRSDEAILEMERRTRLALL